MALPTWQARSHTQSTVRRRTPVSAIVALFSCLSPDVGVTQEPPTLDLTPEEQAWLAANPVIRIGPDPSGPPLEYIGEDGEYLGIAADYAALLEDMLGVRLEVQRRESMSEIVESTLAGEIDLWMGAVRTDERDEYLLFTDPYVEFRAVMLVREEQQEPLQLQDLAGRRVVGTEGYASIEWLRQNVPGIEITPVANTVEGLLAVSFGSADVIVVSNALASYYIAELGLTNLRVAGQLDYVWQLAIASRRDWPLLNSIVQKALDTFSEEQRTAIYGRWVRMGGALESRVAEQAQRLELTQEERAWLDSIGPIRLGPAPNFAPVEFFDSAGVYLGIVADYLSIIEARLGVTFQVEQRDTWTDVVASTRRGEIDVWPEAQATDERRDFMVFTEPYLTLPAVIIVNRDEPGSLTADDLAGRRVALVAGTAIMGYLNERLPGLDVVIVPDIQTGLQRVSFGSVDAYVGTMAPAAYYIDRIGLSNLRVAGASGFEWQLAIGTRSDWPILSDIFQRALDSIEPAERRAIFSRWVSMTEPPTGGFRIAPWLGVVLATLLAGGLVGLVVWRRPREVMVRVDGTRSGWPVYAAALGVIALIVSGTLWAQGQLATRMRQDVGDALFTVLNTTSQAVYYWLREKEDEVVVWSNHPDVRRSCQQLSAVQASREPPGSASQRAALQNQLGSLLESRGHLGFFLMAPDRKILASDDPRNVGSTADSPPIAALVEEVKHGSRRVAIGLPRPAADYESGERGARAAMVVAAAVVDADEAVACVLAFVADPEQEFTEILQRGRLGESGESYAFNRRGQLISDSRFEEDLRRIGLIPEEGRSILTVQIRDPGGNLVRGHTPDLSREDQPLTRMAAGAVGGGAGTDLDGYNDYRGVPVVGAWVWDEANGLGIATEMDVDEAYASLTWVRRLFAGGAGLVVGLVIALTLMFSVDTARRRRMEARLTRQSAALGAAADAIQITDVDGTVAWVNPAFSKLTGYSFDEVVGQSDSFIESSEHDESFYEDIKKTITDGLVWDGEILNRRKDHTLYTVDQSITPVRDSRGDIVNFVAIKRDITERKQMEEELEKARLRMEDELNLGREIQMSMLPLIFPPFPERHDFSVYATLEPAREVGGDFYDFYLLDDDRLCFCVGDVSGKGVPAALFMAVTKALIKSRASEDHSPGSILSHVNDQISSHNEASMFVTIFLAIVNLKTGAFSYTNAGHNPPYVKRRNGALVRLEERHGPVIGAIPGLTYGEAMGTLSLSDQLLLYTDGVTEAMDPEQRIYGEPRLIRLLESRNFKSPEDLVRRTALDVRIFEGGADQADDITILGVQYFGVEQVDDRALVLEMDVRRHLSEIERVNNEFNAFAREHGISDRTRRPMNLVFDELLNNIVSYAFTGTEAHDISIRVELRGPRLDVTIRDSGVSFDPFVTAAPDVTLSLEERSIGGLGIHIVTKVMDEVSYARVEDRNVVNLVKYLEEDGTA